MPLRKPLSPLRASDSSCVRERSRIGTSLQMGRLRAKSVYRYTVLICPSKKLRCNYYRIKCTDLKYLSDEVC